MTKSESANIRYSMNEPNQHNWYHSTLLPMRSSVLRLRALQFAADTYRARTKIYCGAFWHLDRATLAQMRSLCRQSYACASPLTALASMMRAKTRVTAATTTTVNSGCSTASSATRFANTIDRQFRLVGKALGKVWSAVWPSHFQRQSGVQSCLLSVSGATGGGLLRVLTAVRSTVTSEDVVDGTNLFLLEALLPVAESFGFAEELLKKTSGAATTPQLRFSHWGRLALDPFWKPQTEEEREEEGEEGGHLSMGNIARRYIDMTRKRKGMPTAEKIVVAAEKQRNLSLKK
ncbi:hypothetical protein JKP88DRAFT_295337 [Tribonema minus]|uniref:Elongation factor EFG domain-containing protein n=1 Tax=Tribonema minus TaxID=303371 RepID=A0A836CQ82_9STRA|nr:hypothetical protein JKP88DRAFT_295337 [Tribonema minus]